MILFNHADVVTDGAHELLDDLNLVKKGVHEGRAPRCMAALNVTTWRSCAMQFSEPVCEGRQQR